MKKVLAVILCLVMLLPIIAACGNSNNDADTGSAPGDSGGTTTGSGDSSGGGDTAGTTDGPVTLNIFVAQLTAHGTNDDEVVDTIQQKIFEDTGMNIKLNFYSAAGDEQTRMLTLHVAAGEIDMFNANGPYVGRWMAEGALTPLDDLLDQYGANIKAMTPETAWSSAMFKGQILGIPTVAAWASYVGTWMRKDLLDKVGLQPPTTLSEFETALRAFKEYDPTIIPLDSDQNIWLHTCSLIGYQFPESIYDNNGDLLPYIGHEQDFYYTTEAFYELFSITQQWYRDGLINPEIWTWSGDKKIEELRLGRIGAMSTGWWQSDNFDYTAGVDPDNPLPEGQEPQEWIQINMTGSWGQPLGIGTSKPPSGFIGIMSTTPHPDLCVRLVDWLCSDLDNAVLAMFGREGQEWDYDGDGNRISRNVEGQPPVYESYSGQIHNCLFAEEFAKLSNVNQGWRASVIQENFINREDADIAYVFEGEVLAAYEAGMNLWIELWPQMATGLKDVDVALEELEKGLEAINWDLVLAERNKQYREARGLD